MFIIARNLTTRNPDLARAIGGAAKTASPGIDEAVGTLARDCLGAGADALDINLQQHFDKPQVMEAVVNAVQKAVSCQLCLSCNHPDTLEAGLRLCERPPIVNYVSLDTERLQAFLPLAGKYQAEVILLTADTTPPSTLEDGLKTSAVLVGAANEAGIPNQRLLIDPGVLHVTNVAGQRQSQTLQDLIPALSEAFDPAVRSICWVENVSAGAPSELRAYMNSAYFSFLSGLGLAAAFVDVLDPGMARMRRLIRIFSNELIYSDGELAPEQRFRAARQQPVASS